ncbi:serine--tRNA ligase [Candidatus Schneideria nysicola]|uniref:serine--tRNA ligase n=1 Tax=Candidatus Schneideria nysicola TaxID=1081631 RepID=UPI001CAA79BD|nr:serine--tRNA ligase [Candidatus Schneideria nysicola]UAJ64884.1 serine--tRNA ligase [Candidatus Schneideria nysicola]
MIDPNLLRYELETTAKKLQRRQYQLDIENIKKKEASRKKLQKENDSLREQRNSWSKESGYAKIRGENIDFFRSKMNQINHNLDQVKLQLAMLRETIQNDLMSIPNIPDDSIPDGLHKNNNKEVLRWGNIKQYNFLLRDHTSLGKMMGYELNFSVASKITGSRFVVMCGDIAKIHRALIQFMLDLHVEKHGYKEYYLPYLVNQTSLYGTGQLPKFEDELFHILNEKKNNRYTLIPTAEVPLINLIRNEIIEEKILPLKMVAHTPCFRAEAGAYGKDTRGLIRMHQFDKVELVQIVQPQKSMEALEAITLHAEKVLQLLDLPYRKILLCAGELSFASCKTYDLEVWFPYEKRYYEVSSCSNVSDFQSRRIHARYRIKGNKKLYLLHTLNGSGLAVGRTLAAILENYQLPDGGIEIPKVLKPYMKNLKKLYYN